MHVLMMMRRRMLLYCLLHASICCIAFYTPLSAVRFMRISDEMFVDTGGERTLNTC